MMKNAQTHTMTVVMTHATRFPAASPVQMTMSPTIMFAREARPAVRFIASGTRMHSIAGGSNQRSPGVSKKLETRKILGRILKARLLIVGRMQRDVLQNI